MINKKPLINFIIWTFSLILLCIIGVSNVFAYTYENVGYQNNNSEVYALTNYLPSPVNLPRTDNSKYFTGGNSEYLNGLLILTDQLNLDSSYVYQFEVSTPGTTLSLANTADVVYGTANNTTGSCNVLSVLYTNEYPQITFKCNTGGVNITELSVTYRNTSNTAIITGGTNLWWNYVFMRRQIDDTSSNTQDIINNQNQNAQDIQNTINDNLQTCHNSYNILNFSDFLSTRGATFTYSNGVYSITNLGSTYSNPYTLTLEPNTTYTISQKYQSQSSSNLRVDILKNGSGLVSCYATNENITKQTFTTDSSSVYTLRINYSNFSSPAIFNNIMLQKGSLATSFEPYGEEICTNKLDEQKNAINNLDNTLKDDNVDENGIADAFDDFNDFLDDNSTITQLITLPITLYTAILNNLNGSCSPFNLGELYGEDLILPCINVSQYLGNSLWTMIDIIISGFAVYAISKKMIKVFNNFSSLREGDVIDD